MTEKLFEESSTMLQIEISQLHKLQKKKQNNARKLFDNSNEITNLSIVHKVLTTKIEQQEAKNQTLQTTIENLKPLIMALRASMTE